MSAQEGQLKQRINQFRDATLNDFTDEEKAGRDEAIKEIENILTESKKDFPKKVLFDHPDSDNPDEASNDADEFYVWFKKWFGEQK
jgi:hypothetical protein